MSEKIETLYQVAEKILNIISKDTSANEKLDQIGKYATDLIKEAEEVNSRGDFYRGLD